MKKRDWDVGGSHGNSSRNHSGFDRGRMQHRGKKLELPMFEGDDPFEWLFREDRYFAVNGIAEGDKVYATSVFRGTSLELVPVGGFADSFPVMKGVSRSGVATVWASTRG